VGASRGTELPRIGRSSGVRRVKPIRLRTTAAVTIERLASEVGGIVYETAGRGAAEYFRFGKVDVVENVRPLKPKLFGNTHFWLET
jgi:hypothetical protein